MAPSKPIAALPIISTNETRPSGYSSTSSSFSDSPSPDFLALGPASNSNSPARSMAQHSLEILADRYAVENLCKAVLHTIFFHRYFGPVKPTSYNVLDLTLAATDDANIHALVNEKVSDLLNDINRTISDGRGQISLMFLEKRRRETYFFSAADEDVCWEKWNISVTLATPRSQEEHTKLAIAMKHTLLNTANRIVQIALDQNYLPDTGAGGISPHVIIVNPQLPEATTGITALWGIPTRLGFGRAGIFAS